MQNKKIQRKFLNLSISTLVQPLHMLHMMSFRMPPPILGDEMPASSPYLQARFNAQVQFLAPIQECTPQPRQLEPPPKRHCQQQPQPLTLLTFREQLRVLQFIPPLVGTLLLLILMQQVFNQVDLN